MNNKIIHLDLFSGIGGFSYAVDQVWDNVEHIFCDNDKFCRQVIKKHWPNSYIYEDIRAIVANTTGDGLDKRKAVTPKKGCSEKPQYNRKLEGRLKRSYSLRYDILTGGFPCQPFSQAGKRGGTADDRYLWPEMLRVIQLTKPTWIIAENVRGLLTWNEGMVFEQVCTDMEREGYEVQPFVIPAVAVNAPHRRDRIWFVASRTEQRLEGEKWRKQSRDSRRSAPQDRGKSELWDKNWIEVATELCSLDDGLPVELGEFKLSAPAHRREQLKAYGNAIVPQVAIEIMKGIRSTYEMQKL
jgi:DNA (cytosine-5)-methyltransferase 1